jgi:magnesium transporter
MTAQTTFYFSRTLNRKFYSSEGKPLGKVKDLLIELIGSRPRVIAIKVKIRGKDRILDFTQFELVKAVTHYIIKCNNIIDFNIPEGSRSIFLAESVLDRQIVDINGRKLVRVNDFRLVIIPTGVFVIGVDVGLEGLLRRIGISHQIKTCLSWFNLSLPSNYILWDDVEAIDTLREGIRLSTSYKKLHTLHPSDLADIIEDMDRHTRINVFKALDEEKAADVLEELEEKAQVHVIETLSTEKAADVLEKMPAHEAADIIDQLEPDKAEELLNEMTLETSDDVRELMGYEENTVGSIMSAEYVSFNRNVTVGQVIDELRKSKPEDDVLYSILIVDDRERLIGTLSLRDLVVSEPSLPLHTIMDMQLITVFDDEKIDSLVEIIDKYNMLAVPVIDSSSKIQGLVMIDQIIEELADK